MTRLAVYGTAQGLDGREAAIKASQMALDQLGMLKPVFGIVFASEEFDTVETLAGLAGLIGDVPLWGVSTVRPLTGDSEKPRSIVVALIAGQDLKASVLWVPGYAEDSQEAARQIGRVLRSELILPQVLLLAADGVAGSLLPVCAGLADLPVMAGGCLASGSYSSGKTDVFGKNQAGPGALSAALLSGRFRVGSGSGHGWQDTGLNFMVTKARDVWIQGIDGQPVTEMLAKIFGRPAREWSFPPLNELVRLYPLGVEPALRDDELILRSPLRIEVDGSMRMSTPVAEGSRVHLMLGDPEGCLKAAATAAQLALADLGNAHPLVALAYIDLAWLYLMENRPNQVAQVLQETLGSIPLVGAYTLGQMVRSSVNSVPVINNQGVTVQILGTTD
jgi:hypothetical protein